MQTRAPLFVLLASALTFLASLFLPWREATVPPFTDHGLQALDLADAGRIDGWVGIAGDIAVLLVVAIVLATVATLRSPNLGARPPIGGLGVALGYFAVGVAHEAHTLAGELGGGFTGKPPTFHTSWTYGFYLGVASAGIAALSALAFRRDEPMRLRGAADAVAGVLGIGLLTSFLLPWVEYPSVHNYSVHGIEIPPAAITALALFFSAGPLHGEAGRRWRLPCAVAAAILTGGAASAVGITGGHAYAAWIGVGCAVLLVALEAVRAWPERLPALAHGSEAVRAGAAALLIVALFLPWLEFRHGVASGQGTDGWYSVPGTAAGTLCLLLLAASALPTLETYVLDTVAAVAIFVSAAATVFRQETIVYRIGYGAFIGVVAAGILVVTAIVALRPGHVDRGRALARAVPLALSVLCVAAVVVPMWFVVPVAWRFQSEALYGSMTVPGVLVGLYLVRLWARRVRGPAATGHRLVLVPLVLLTLASLELIRFRDSSDVLWGAIILVGLSLMLVLFGWMEEKRGLEGFRVPEILRVDRLPETES
jgi:hypothetical protein